MTMIIKVYAVAMETPLADSCPTSCPWGNFWVVLFISCMNENLTLALFFPERSVCVCGVRSVKCLLAVRKRKQKSGRRLRHAP